MPFLLNDFSLLQNSVVCDFQIQENLQPLTLNWGGSWDRLGICVILCLSQKQGLRDRGSKRGGLPTSLA